jgi:hypothetical protein
VNPESLQLASELGGTILLSERAPLLVVERVKEHRFPRLLVFGQNAEDLETPLKAIELAHVEGLPLNLIAILFLGSGDLAKALVLHQKRLGSMLGALDASLPWLMDRPMMAKRLPGRIECHKATQLEPAFLGPMERVELASHLQGSNEALERVFISPPWAKAGEMFQHKLWSDVPIPPEAKCVQAPMKLSTTSPFFEAFRMALRAALGHPIPLLPQDENPRALQAMAQLTPNLAAFRGPLSAWSLALRAIAELPAPPHFCARC